MPDLIMIKVNLMKGDCLEKMKEIPDKSVDMVLADPPYGTTACKWDSVIPFDLMWEQLRRIVKNERSVIVLFGSEPFSSRLRLSNIEMFKYDWKWIKNRNLGANFAHSANSPIKVIEDVCVFSSGKIAHKGKHANRMTYNPQDLKPCKQIERRRMPEKITAFRRNIASPSHSEYVREWTNYPDNTLTHDFSKNENKKDRLHPTQKPVALLEYLVKTYTLEGETILDFTMGSGSTGVACKKLNRNFIGIERDDKYFEIAKERIEKA